MDFRTELPARVSNKKIELSDSIITMGSCFSDDIGARLSGNKFIINANPLGTVYNPISIHKLLLYAIQKSKPSQNGFIERDGISFHFDFHSTWNGQSQDDLNKSLVQELKNVHDAVMTCKHLIITYGTSWVYEEKYINEIVTNCHKIPQGNFNKFLLTQKRIVESFESFYTELKNINKNVRVILTVSPVRHIKDTLELNSVSKSILRLTCYTLSQEYSGVEYFPSYEIMLDDLRDYRFYKSDLIHPSDVAIGYIWEKFGETYFDEGTLKFIGEWGKIRLALEHKPFQSSSKSHQQFLKETLNRLTQIGEKVDVRDEIEALKRQLQ